MRRTGIPRPGQLPDRKPSIRPWSGGLPHNHHPGRSRENAMNLSDQDYEAALQRVRDFRKQQDESASLADQGSFQVARDSTALLADGRWAQDLPPVKRSHLRGRPVDPMGRSRFATWLREHERYTPRT